MAANSRIYELIVPNGQRDRRLISVVDPFSRSALPEVAIAGEFTDNSADENSFVENPVFVRFLHRCVEMFGPQSPGLRAEADRQKNGVIMVIDQRSGNILGRVEPIDIIGGFEVIGSQVHPETYRPNPNYRLLTRAGFFQLDQYIEKKMIEELQNFQ